MMVLPEGVTSVYSYYCQMEAGHGKPLYFNQIKVPPFWEITGTNGEGEIWEYSEKRAKIFYAEPKHLRHVKNVDWMDKNEKFVLQTITINMAGSMLGPILLQNKRQQRVVILLAKA